MLQIQGAERPLLFVLRDEALWWVLVDAAHAGRHLARRGAFGSTAAVASERARFTSRSSIVLSVGHIAVFGAAYYWVVGPTSWGPTRGRRSYVFEARYLATDIVIYAAALGVYFAFEYFDALPSHAARCGAVGIDARRGCSSISSKRASMRFAWSSTRTFCSTR